VTLIVTAAVLPGLVDDELSSIQTAVLLPAALHALALGQWSQVISRLGITAASDTLSGPSRCRPSRSGASTRGPS